MTTPVFWGSEFLVNTAALGEQSGLSLTALKDGSFVATWLDDSGSGQTNIRGQIFGSDGTKKGDEFQIGIADGIEGSFQAVTVLSNGRFVVGWADDAGDVRARLFNANGLPAGDEFTIDADRPDAYTNISIAPLGDGFVVSYEITDFMTQPVAAWARAYDGTGASLGGAFKVDDGAGLPSVAGLTGGAFAVLYEDAGGMVHGRILATDGQPIQGTTEFEIGSTKTECEPSVTALSDGRFVVVWTANDAATREEIYGQIFNADGTPSGSRFKVNVATANSQASPVVVALKDGGFAVAFNDWSSDSGDIRLSIFDRTGARNGDEIRVNTGTQGQQITAKMTQLEDGRLVVGWNESANGRADDVSGIRAQIIDPRGAAVTIAGSAGDDQYFGTGFDDTLSGQAGADRLIGASGNDVLNGGLGADVLDGGAGFDFVSFASATSGVVAGMTGGTGGEATGDVFTAIEGLIGSSYADTLYGNGNASLQGGRGNDLYRVGGADKVVESAGGGSDTVYATTSYALAATAEIEVLRAAGASPTAALNLTGSNSANTIIGNAGRNILKGLNGNDKLYGGTENDVLYGGVGNDLLKGDAGNDKVCGGYGNDVLYGGAGRDAFLFDAPLNKANLDKVVDFSTVYDTVWIDNRIFAKLGAGTLTKPLKLNAANFAYDTAKDANDFVIYNKATGKLSIDIDGSGARAAIDIALFKAGTALYASDIYVI